MGTEVLPPWAGAVVWTRSVPHRLTCLAAQSLAPGTVWRLCIIFKAGGGTAFGHEWLLGAVWKGWFQPEHSEPRPATDQASPLPLWTTAPEPWTQINLAPLNCVCWVLRKELTEWEPEFSWDSKFVRHITNIILEVFLECQPPKGINHTLFLAQSTILYLHYLPWW